MTEKLSWIRVLNEEAEWQRPEDMIKWLSTNCGQRLNPSKKAQDGFAAVLRLMRGVVDAFHFGEDLKLDWMDKRLGRANFALGYEDWLPVPLSEFLPLLHARVRDSSDDALLEAISDTLVLQFSQFVDSVLGSDEEHGVARCLGVFRLPGNAKLDAVPSASPESEMRWRKEVELLNNHGLTDTPELQRCPDLFIASPKARFCSDACRFTTFQIAKHLNAPGYHAEKQKRYRKKQADK